MSKAEAISPFLVRLPEGLKEAGQARAESLGISLNKLLVFALEREVSADIGKLATKVTSERDVDARAAGDITRSQGVPEIAGLVKASELPDPKTTDCRHTNALIHRGNGRYVCRKCGEVVDRG